MAFSPVLRFEEIIDAMDPERSIFCNPVLTNLQSTVQKRVQLKGHDHYPGFDPRAYVGSLRKLIDYEFARSEMSYPGCVADVMQFCRFLPYKGLPDGDKLASARIPVLIVQAANDPLECAQDAADLIAKTPNPNLAVVVLAGGGHVGFAAYARAYYFSLIVNFFDRQADAHPAPLH
jgi:predicted alpha/beta-fold hydrolase